jgi:hypothetical protein
MNDAKIPPALPRQMTSAMEIAFVGPSQLSEAHVRMQGAKNVTCWLERYLSSTVHRKYIYQS